MAAFYLYAIIWRKIVYKLLKKTLLRNAAAESCDNMAGEEGVFRKIENREFVFGTVNYGKLNIQVHAISAMEKKYI